MLDVKTLLKTTGLEVGEDVFLKPPPLPYIIFSEDLDKGGADNKNCILDRSIIIELYSAKKNISNENLIENLLDEKSIEYKKTRSWIDSEKLFQTIYEFSLYEKIGGI